MTSWAVDSVTNMGGMFNRASAFDQDLGWCVDDGVHLGNAFFGTACVSTSCGVVGGSLGGWGCAPSPAPRVVDAAHRLSSAGAALLALALAA